jgi:hypothetical protein
MPPTLMAVMTAVRRTTATPSTNNPPTTVSSFRPLDAFANFFILLLVVFLFLAFILICTFDITVFKCIILLYHHTAAVHTRMIAVDKKTPPDGGVLQRVLTDFILPERSAYH